MILVEFAPEEGERRSFSLHLQCHTPGLRFLQDLAEFAWSRGGGDLDSVIGTFLRRGVKEVA